MSYKVKGNYSAAVKVKQSSFIPLSGPDLERLLRLHLPSDRHMQWGQLCELLRATYHFRAYKASEQIKRDFMYLHRDSADSDDEQVRKRFVEQLHYICEKANYHKLSGPEWDMAKAEDFNFHLPIDVHWDKLDSTLFAPYRQQQRQHNQDQEPPFADRILILHRGVGQARLNERFVAEKLDIVVNRLLVQPTVAYCHKVVTRVRAALGTGCEDSTGAESASTRAADAAEHSAAAARPSAPVIAPTSAACSSQPPQCTHIRRTLNMLPTSTLLKNLTQHVEIIEPTFEKLIVVYRGVKTSPASSANTAAPSNTQKTSPALSTATTTTPAVRLTSFSNVPMADAEIVFPFKHVDIHATAKLQLVVMLILMLYTLYATYTGDNNDDTGASATRGSGDLANATATTLNAPVTGAGGTGGNTDGSGSGLGWALAAVLGARLMQLNTALTKERNTVRDTMTSSLYKSMNDNGLAVLLELVDSMEEQEYKEALLGYWSLLRQQPLSKSEREVDDDCEKLLAQQGLSVDFEADDALNKLVKDGLVRRTAGAKYCAQPIANALITLDKLWDNIFDFGLDADADANTGADISSADSQIHGGASGRAQLWQRRRG